MMTARRRQGRQGIELAAHTACGAACGRRTPSAARRGGMISAAGPRCRPHRWSRRTKSTGRPAARHSQSTRTPPPRSAERVHGRPRVAVFWEQRPHGATSSFPPCPLPPPTAAPHLNAQQHRCRAAQHQAAEVPAGAGRQASRQGGGSGGAQPSRQPTLHSHAALPWAPPHTASEQPRTSCAAPHASTASWRQTRRPGPAGLPARRLLCPCSWHTCQGGAGRGAA